MHLGKLDVEAMLESLTWNQFMGWLAYSHVEPFGEDRADLRMGITTSVIANANRDSKRKPEPFKPSDFMPDFAQDKPQPAPLTSKDAWSKVKNMAKSLARSKAMEDAPKRSRRRGNDRGTDGVST